MKQKKIFFLNVFLFVILLLFIIKFPFTFLADDSPETISCFQLLTIQHPPGYPLNTMLGKIFTLIPLANVMMKANLMSCFFHILSSLVLFLIVKKILKYEKNGFLVFITAIFAMIFYLFSKTAFLQSFSAKGSIYTLHSFLTAVMFFSLIQINKEKKYFYLLVFLFGMALTNHWPSTVVMIPGIILFLFFSKFKIQLKNIFYLFLFFIIGLSPFLFFFIRTRTNPEMLWPVNNLQDFLWMFSRKLYSGIDTQHTINDSMRFFKYFFTDIFPAQYPFLIILFAIPGVFLFYDYNRIFCISSLTVVICMIFGVAAVNIITEKMEWVIEPYFVFVFLFVSIYIGFLIFKILDFIKNFSTFKIISILLTCSILILLYRNCPDYSKYYLAYDYVHNIFKTLPDESVFFAEGDLNVAGSIYTTGIEKKKIFLIIPSLLNQKWYRDIIRKNLKDENEFVDHKSYIRNIVLLNPERKFFYSNIFTKTRVDFNLLQKGIVYEISADFIKPFKKYDYYKDFLVYSFRGALGDVSYDEGTKTFVLNNFGRCWYETGRVFEQCNEKMQALFYFTRAFNFFKDDILAYKTGLLYFDIDDTEKSIYYLKEAVKINPRNIEVYRALVAHGVLKNDYSLMRKYAKEILKYDKNNRDAINLLKEIGQ